MGKEVIQSIVIQFAKGLPTVTNKVLDANYIRSLMAGKRQLEPKPKSTKADDISPLVTLSSSNIMRPDPTKQPRAGEMLSGDKGDIWAQWMKQHRVGAIDLIERWGT